MNRREMLNLSFRNIAQTLPSLIAAATGLSALNGILTFKETEANSTTAACFPKKKNSPATEELVKTGSEEA